MSLIKKIFIIFFLLLPISNSFAAMHTFLQKAAVTDGTNNDPSGVHFNPAGTKMFILSQSPDNSADDVFSHVSEYNLSTPFDVSTKTYAGDGERCILNNGEGNRSSEYGPTNWMHDLKFSHDGMILFVARSNAGSANANADRVFRFDLTSPYDISSCNFPVGSAVHATSNLDDDDLQDGSNAGTVVVPSTKNRLRGFDFSNDGKKLFVLFGGSGSNHYVRLLEYQLSIAYDLSTISIVTDAGIRLQDPGSVTTPVGNAKGLDFSPDGKRLWVVDHGGTNYPRDITQISLDVAFSTSSFKIDGTVEFNISGYSQISQSGNGAPQPSGLTFSTNGLKMYTMNDEDEDVLEYDLVCPFNIIEGKCPPITENSVRTGIAEVQIMIAKRTIDHSTKSALNRIKWIRRNKDNQNLSNLNIDLNFNTATQLENPLLNYWVKKIPDRIVAVNEEVENGQSITIGREYKKRNKSSNNLDNFTTAFKSDNPLVNAWFNKLPKKITARQASLEKKTEDKQQDIFFWSEGSIAIGRVGDTNISSFKKIGTEAITLGADKFTDNNGIRGLAFRMGNNNVDVGMGGSNIDTDTFNLTYYSTTPLENDTKSEDIIIGFGKLKYDILTVLDGKHIKASRVGTQVYFTNKFKDEIKKDNFTLIPSFQADVGHTILDGYTESGNGAIKVEDQLISTRKLRASIAMVEGLANDWDDLYGIKYTLKRHGKLEYMVDLGRSSNFKYAYVSDNTTDFSERLYSGAVHNVNSEIGIDIDIDNMSIFLIYERNQALGTGHTDNINIAFGYLPNKGTNYSVSLNGIDNTKSNYIISKNINDFFIDFKLSNNLMRPKDYEDASINLSSKF